MYAYDAYQSQRQPPMARVDAVLLAYRKSIEWIEQAKADMQGSDRIAALAKLAKAQLVVESLAGGVSAAADPMSANFLRLYEFVAHSIAQATPGDLEAATKVLRTLAEGFEAARDQAVALETRGQIPSLGTATLEVTA